MKLIASVLYGLRL